MSQNVFLRHFSFHHQIHPFPVMALRGSAVYFIETSKSLAKESVDALLSEWDRSRIRDTLASTPPMEILRMVVEVQSALSDNARLGAPAAMILLQAAEPLVRTLPPEGAEVFMNSVEAYLVPGADYISQLQGCATLLSALRTILRGYTTLIIANQSRVAAGLETLSVAMKVFSPASHHLTPAHALFLQVALSTNAIARAVERIDKVIITEIDPSATGVLLPDFLCYYYYAGIVYVSAKRWKDSIWSFESCLTVRSYGCNAIMMAACKAYILVSLIADGSVRSLLNTYVDKYARVVCREYLELQEAFENRNFVEVNALMVKHARVFEEDQLTPLARECHIALLRHAIRALTNVYVSCTLAGIAEEMGTTEDVVRDILVEMICAGEVHGEISQTVPYTITFSDAETVSSSMLDEAIVRCDVATAAVEEARQDVLASVQYATNELRNHPRFSELMAEHEAKKRDEKSAFRKLASMLHH
jgi:hypothetical protein